MANKKPKPRDPEAARQQALKQWSDPASKLRAANRKANLIDPPKDAATLVEKAAANGCTVAQIAHALEVSPQTLRRWREEYPEIKAAFDAGRQNEHDSLVGALFGQAMKGNVTASIFLLKARHGYVEGASATPNTVSVNFILPRAKTPEEYAKSLAANAQVIEPDRARALLEQPKVKRAIKNDLHKERREAEEAE
jgi:transposase-like protein